MSKFKFIPGPYKGDEFGCYVWAPAKTGGDCMIAQIRGWGYLTGKDSGALGLSHEEAEEIQKANQRLLSASPEMLDLLIEMGKFGEDQYPDDPDTGLFGSARKLAEKATGLSWEKIKECD